MTDSKKSREFQKGLEAAFNRYVQSQKTHPKVAPVKQKLPPLPEKPVNPY